MLDFSPDDFMLQCEVESLTQLSDQANENEYDGLIYFSSLRTLCLTCLQG